MNWVRLEVDYNDIFGETVSTDEDNFGVNFELVQDIKKNQFVMVTVTVAEIEDSIKHIDLYRIV